MNKNTQNCRTPDIWSNTPNPITLSQLINNIKLIIKQNVTPLGTPIDRDIRTTESLHSYQMHDTGDTSKLSSPLKDLNAIILLGEVNYHRKVELEDVDINKKTKQQLEKLCNDYTDIFSKQVTDIAKANRVQMSLHPKASMKPLD